MKPIVADIGFKKNKIALFLLLGVLILLSVFLCAWLERTWPFVFAIIYLSLLISIGLRSTFWLLGILIFLHPLIPYYPIEALRGAALQDIFFVFSIPILLMAVPLKNRRRAYPLIIPYIALASWALLSAIATQDNIPDFLVAFAKGTGRPLIIALTALFVATAISDFKRSTLLYKLIALSATLQAVIGILAFAFNIEIITGNLHLGVMNLPYQLAAEVNISRRLQGTFCTGNLTGAYFVAILPLTLSLIINSKKLFEKIFWVTCFFLQTSALILTYTRASLVAAGFALILFLLLLSKSGHLKITLFVLIILLSAFALLQAILPEGITIVKSRFISIRPEVRLAPAWAGLMMLAEHPVWGVGVDNAVPLMESDPRYSQTPFGETYIRPHNSFIFIGAELGLLASLILLWAFISISKFILKAWRSSINESQILLSAAVLSGWFGQFIHSFTNNLYHHPSLMVTQIALIAALTPIIYSNSKINENRKGGPPLEASITGYKERRN
jgi:O-antigen ligase